MPTAKLSRVELAKLLGVTVPVPSSFEGIPVLNNQRSWFFAYADKRGAGDIDALWKVFVAASRMGDDDQADTRDTFVQTMTRQPKYGGLPGIYRQVSTGHIRGSF